MVPNYRTITLSAGANENIVPLIYKVLQKEGYQTPRFTLDFIGFEADAGTSFKINGNPLKVPSNERFITPYGENSFLSIHSVTFDQAFTGIDFYIIY